MRTPRIPPVYGPVLNASRSAGCATEFYMRMMYNINRIYSFVYLYVWCHVYMKQVEWVLTF